MIKFTQKIREKNNVLGKVELQIMKFAEWYAQHEVEISIPNLKFKTNLGYLEALLPCIEAFLKEFKK